MESKAISFLHTFGIVILCIALYKSFVQPITPTPIQGWIGI